IPNGPLSVDANGNVGIGTTTKTSRLELRGEFVRKIQMVTGLGPNDQTINGRIASRTLIFNKMSSDTFIRILYCDNIRSYNPTGPASGQWEIRINGIAPASGRIYHDFHINCGGISNIHVPTTILGYAGGIGSGKHEIQVWVGPCTDGWLNNLWTGWNNSRWTIEAQEVWL
ncbi:MAG: hypothetical protein OEV66_03435, partial [Spirochaetia bacterium]|nr:hypothetical protein [Spirochaetia bacterium]